MKGVSLGQGRSVGRKREPALRSPPCHKAAPIWSQHGVSTRESDAQLSGTIAYTHGSGFSRVSGILWHRLGPGHGDC